MGADAVFLAVTLLAIGILLTYLGTRLRGRIGVKKPGKTVIAFMMLIWGLYRGTCLTVAIFCINVYD